MLGKSGKGLNGIIVFCGGGGMFFGIVFSVENIGFKIFGVEFIYEGVDDVKCGYYFNECILVVFFFIIVDGFCILFGVYIWFII